MSTYAELGFERVSTWEGSWRGDKRCQYCGEDIEVGDRVRYREGGGGATRGLRHAACAREEKDYDDFENEEI